MSNENYTKTATLEFSYESINPKLNLLFLIIFVEY